MRNDYDILEHGMMLGDTRRLQAYLEAIRHVVRPGDVVADIGSGTGIFALAACAAGARRVFAIESGPIVEVAREVLAINGCADRVQIIPAFSTAVDLPELADVVVMDVRNILPDDQIPVAVDARARLLASGGRLLPTRDVIWAVPIEAPDLRRRTFDPWRDDATGLDLTPVRAALLNHWRKADVHETHLAASPRPVVTLDYSTLDESAVAGHAVWEISRSVTVDGWAVWFDTDLGGGVTLSNRPGGTPLLYGQAFFAWPDAVSLVSGDRLTLDFTGEPRKQGYEWRTVTRIEGPSRPVPVVFAQGVAREQENAPDVPCQRSMARDLRVLEAVMASTSQEDLERRLVESDPAPADGVSDARAVFQRLCAFYG